MRQFSKFITGAAAAAVLSVSAAAPASAQSYRSDRGGIDAGDVIAGVAIIGGIAAIAAALDRDGDRGDYGYGNNNGYGNGYGYRDGYRNGYQVAVRACGREASRYSRGRVQITDVDRRDSNKYRVRGVIDGGQYNRGYDRGYDRNDRYGNASFTCTARADGRITKFRTS